LRPGHEPDRYRPRKSQVYSIFHDQVINERPSSRPDSPTISPGRAEIWDLGENQKYSFHKRFHRRQELKKL
jgi:hypothetical protein